MSARKPKMKKEKPSVEPKEPKPPTASQLFDRYMKAVARANGLAERLGVEISEAERLSAELSERFGVHVGNKPPARKAKPHETQPVPRDPASNVPEQEQEPDPDAPPYEPPAQIHADAPRLSAKSSQEVEQIRRDSGLSTEEAEAADSEALAAEGTGRMFALQKGMSGTPAVIPSPGRVEGAPPEPKRDNSKGGPTTQKPVEEE